MPDNSNKATKLVRRPAVLAVAFSCALFATGQDVAPEPPATKPAETLATVRQRLTRIKPDQRSRHEAALLATLDFVLALGDAQGPRAAARVDAVGYQALPLSGELPERPARAIARGTVAKDPVPGQKARGGKSHSRSGPAEKGKDSETIDSIASEAGPTGKASGAGSGDAGTLSQMISAHLQIEVGGLPAECAAVVEREKLRDEFPAVATWMLPTEDLAVVFRPAPGERATGWLSYDACLVVRLRGDRATIVGGNLLEALGIPARR